MFRLFVVSMIIAIISQLIPNCIAQQCGPAPGTVTYSDSFQLGVYKMATSDSGTSAGANATVPVNAIPTVFGFKYDATSHSEDISNTTMQQAHSFVQLESKSQAVNIVAQCRYGLCTLPNTPNSDLAFKALSDICQTALSGSLPSGWSHAPSPLRIEPDLYPVVFDENKTMKVNATIFNDGESVKLDVPLPEGFVSVLNPSHGSFVIPTGGHKEISFLLRKPSSGKVDQPLEFISHDLNSVRSGITFRLVSDSSYFLPPASLACGAIDPHLMHSETADTGGKQGGSLDDTIDVANPSPKSIGGGFTSNGMGLANASVAASCLILTPGDQENLYTQLSIKTSLMAQCGCCGGNHPGGTATARPEWQSTVFLPPSSQWDFKVTLNPTISGVGGAIDKCTFSVDGQGYSLDQTKSQDSATITLNAGTHALDYSCPTVTLAAYDEGRVDQHNGTDNQILYLSAKRHH